MKTIIVSALCSLVLAQPVMAQQSVFIGVPMFSEYVPGNGGQEDAAGDFDSEFDSANSRICYYLELNGVRNPIGLAIHRGEEGENGPQVVSLTLPNSPDEETCVTVDGDLIAEMAGARDDFYIIVTTPGNSDGAIRGQLSH